MAAVGDRINIRKLSIINSENEAQQWCREKGLLPANMECPLCGEFSYSQTIRECDETNVPDVAESTITDWFSYLREVCRDNKFDVFGIYASDKQVVIFVQDTHSSLDKDNMREQIVSVLAIPALHFFARECTQCSVRAAELISTVLRLSDIGQRIVFQWIPSHCGILGNENADALAKKGSTATFRPVTKSTYYSVKRFIKSTYLDFNKQNLITQSQGKKWNSLHQNPQLIPDLPRKSSVAAFILATGHDCLAKHLHRIGIYQSPNCPLCNSNQEMDSEHLKICASLAGHDNIFEKYWSARGQMTLL
ncbi:hypothetical protein ANN_11244 [Periplaneta americana]|uniref:RNase H type-1 domain-containing protein n=1 Tax=Periplaneta americana TaxID=6978 RepID=A0ABQ8T4G6_PERAM|nr:hypothetical protein ANN_11244 [Periplaneta americana]